MARATHYRPPRAPRQPGEGRTPALPCSQRRRLQRGPGPKSGSSHQTRTPLLAAEATLGGGSPARPPRTEAPPVFLFDPPPGKQANLDLFSATAHLLLIIEG